MDNLERFILASEMVTSLVEMRKIYDSYVDIVNDKTYSKNERFEAEQLTQGGYYLFVNRLLQMFGDKWA